MHACPQEPQLLASALVSTQVEPHIISPDGQVNVHVLPLQAAPALVSEQAVPQAPQFAVSLRPVQAPPTAQDVSEAGHDDAHPFGVH